MRNIYVFLACFLVVLILRSHFFSTPFVDKQEKVTHLSTTSYANQSSQFIGKYVKFTGTVVNSRFVFNTGFYVLKQGNQSILLWCRQYPPIINSEVEVVAYVKSIAKLDTDIIVLIAKEFRTPRKKDQSISSALGFID